jgi:serine/threonine protein kinase
LPEYLTSDPERLRRFEQEARATAALNHPNILAVFEMDTHEGVSYLVEELLEGETLRERLRRGPIPLRKAIDYAVQIAHGLAAAHDRGIVHRDLITCTVKRSKQRRDLGGAGRNGEHECILDDTVLVALQPERDCRSLPSKLSRKQLRGH